jgi:hypothetical protein
MSPISRFVFALAAAGISANVSSSAAAQQVIIGPPLREPLKVVDSRGRFLGTILNSNNVLIILNGQPLQIMVRPLGFVQQGGPNVFVYPTTDCSGSAFSTAETGLPQIPGQIGNTASPVNPLFYSSIDVYYVGPPYQRMHVKSQLVPGGTCTESDAPYAYVGTPTKTTISGFTPPFSVTR